MKILKLLLKLLRLLFPTLFMKTYEKLIANKNSFSEIGDTIFGLRGKDFLFGQDAFAIANDALVAVGFSREVDKPVIARNCMILMSNHIPDVKLSDDSVIKMFNEHILGIVDLPIVAYNKLVAKGTNDLEKVSAIVNKYEAIPFVQELISGVRQNGRNHEEYTIEAFYKRAKKKAQLIQEFIDNGAIDISIRHSGKFYVEQLAKNPDDSVSNQILNFPYLDSVILNHKLHLEVDLEALDHDLINPYKNKMFVFEFDNDIRSTDYSILDQEILDKLDPKHLMTLLVEEIQQIPLLNERKDVFQELNTMVDQELWYGFYGLALPQVEGIVAELLRIVGASGGNGKALPQKVDALRGFAPNGDFDMDYYQFHLPDKRNKFSHTGKDKDIKTKSFHLLLDLKHLLATAAGLENNLLILNKMANEGSNGINHIGDLTRLIKLKDKVSQHEHYPEVKDKLDNLVYNEIINQFDFEVLLRELSEYFGQQLKDFKANLDIGVFLEEIQPIDFLSLSPKEFDNNMAAIQRAITRSEVFGEAYKIIMDIHIFIAKFPKLFPNLSKEVLEAFEQFENEHKKVWVQLRMLAAKDRSDIFDDILMEKKRMIEILNNAKK